MTNENAREDKPVENLTDEALKRVTGGDFFDALRPQGFIGDYSYCSKCKDYTKTVLLSGNKACGNCGTPRERETP